MTPRYPVLPDGTKKCKRGHSYDAKRSQCNVCRQEKHKQYVKRNKEKMQDYYAAHYRKNKDQIISRKKTEEYVKARRINARKRWSDGEKVKNWARAYRAKNPERPIWAGIISRCNNPNDKGHKNYGARGIKVCARWLRFSAFLQDMGPRPTPHHSVERKDNNKGYNKKNCAWATAGEQSRNTRRTRMLEFSGKRQCVTDWARDLGINPSLLSTRLDRLKWPLERALTTGPYKRKMRDGTLEK